MLEKQEQEITISFKLTLFIFLLNTEVPDRPRGKESTKVRFTQNKGKEREKKVLPKIEELTVKKDTCKHKET